MRPLNQLDRPFVIAEVGSNHEGDFEYAKKLLRDAAESGVDAVKFQAYTSDGMVNRAEVPQRHSHFAKLALTTPQYIHLAELCGEYGVQFMSSIWDYELFVALDPFIEVHKVGSGDLTNYRLLKPLAETGKPLCIATAMANLDEVGATVQFIRTVNPRLVAGGNLSVMHCVAMYGDPRDEYANLGAISSLRSAFPEEIAIGYSDHTVGTAAAIIAVGLGATVIEAHFTDDHGRDFRDHHFALTKEQMAGFVAFCKRRSVLLGDGIKRPIPAVETDTRIRQFRRAVYFRRDMKAGDVVTEADLTTLRPNEGIAASNFFELLGKTLSVDKKALERLSWGDFVESL